MQSAATHPLTATDRSSAAAEDRVQWSRWFRCESTFSLLLLPPQPGVFAVAEEVPAAGEAAGATPRRLLALLQCGAADDLAAALSRLFSSASAVRERLLAGRCYLRYGVIADPAQRDSVARALQAWLAASGAAGAEDNTSAARRAEPGPIQSPSPPSGF